MNPPTLPGLRFTVDDTWGGSLVTAQNAHLAASSDPDLLTGATFFADWTEPLVSTSPRMTARGTGQAPATPGLGVEIDHDALGASVLDC